MSNYLNSFFEKFPGGVICIAGWDRDEKMQPIEKYWSEFTLDELETENADNKRAVFFTPCNMGKPTHKLEDHDSICAWYCDIDLASRDVEYSKENIDKLKSELFGKIFCSEMALKVLPPSLVVETRNGVHLYWYAEYKKASVENFEYIESEIVSRCGGDNKACKLVQLMRLPGFYNWKNKEPFVCKVFKEISTNKVYTDADWLSFLGPKRVEVVETKGERVKRVEALLNAKLKVSPDVAKNATTGLDIFKIVADLPQDQALMVLSGAPEVNGEIYSLRPSSGGRHLNIYINGKICSAFINPSNNALMCRKGAGRGSPNVIEWLKWYNPNMPNHELASVLKKYYGKPY